MASEVYTPVGHLHSFQSRQQRSAGRESAWLFRKDVFSAGVRPLTGLQSQFCSIPSASALG